MIILEGTSDLPVGVGLRAMLHVPGKEVREATAVKDRLHQHSLAPILNEGFLVVGVGKADLEDGTLIEICGEAT
ncbi:hypothetical protein [Rhizobium sp. BR 362]|uniref:hypothetical protein n=1 Tax=Rhizobium sp. BR 362 TaxID=3040670 RepID=UPI002F3E4503